MDLTEQLLRGLADSLLGTRRIVYQGRDYDLGAPVRARDGRGGGTGQHNPGIERGQAARSVPYLRAACERLGIPWHAHDGAGKLQIELFEKTVEHTLIEPTFIIAYPAEVSPLARASDADPFLTDRFEFFLAGRELANGFSELNDPEDQAARFRAQVAAQGRRRRGGDVLRCRLHPRARVRHAADRRLGIGIDRLVMFLTDSPSIRDVILFPQLRPET